MSQDKSSALSTAAREFGKFGPMLAGPKQVDQESNAAIGVRLRALREVIGYTAQAKWCRDYPEFTTQAWNNWEKGRERISYEFAKLLVQNFNIGYDYIYRGQFGNVPEELGRQLRAKIRELTTNPDAPATDRRKRR